MARGSRALSIEQPSAGTAQGIAPAATPTVPARDCAAPHERVGIDGVQLEGLVGRRAVDRLCPKPMVTFTPSCVSRLCERGAPGARDGDARSGHRCRHGGVGAWPGIPATHDPWLASLELDARDRLGEVRDRLAAHCPVARA